MTNPAIEAAARAIDPLAWTEPNMQPGHRNAWEGHWRREGSLAKARAAIASLRVPTPEIIEALGHVVASTGRWQAAIDAALSEPRIESAGSAPSEGGE